MAQHSVQETCRQYTRSVGNQVQHAERGAENQARRREYFAECGGQGRKLEEFDGGAYRQCGGRSEHAWAPRSHGGHDEVDQHRIEGVAGMVGPGAAADEPDQQPCSDGQRCAGEEGPPS